MTRLAFVMALLPVHLVVSNVDTQPLPHTPLVGSSTAFTTTDASRAIHRAGVRYGVAEHLLRAIAICESGLRPNPPSPSGVYGLFQFSPATYWSYARRIGETRTYFNPYASANVAAYAISVGGGANWSASRWCWG